MAKNTPKVYHHSNVKGTVIKIAAIVVAAAFILALTAFFGFKKFAAYTDTGKLYLDIPWLYGYMDGPPEYDELAPYLAPVVTETVPSDTTETEKIPQETGDASSEETSQSSTVTEESADTTLEDTEAE